MRVLLLNPPSENTAREYSDPSVPGGRGAVETEDFGLFPPLGLLYVLSALQRSCPDVETFFLDCVAERIGHGLLAAKIAGIRPDVVGITSYTMSLYDVCLAAKNIRALFSGCHICLGGHHPIAFPFEAAALGEFDSIVVGEGEQAFPALVAALAAEQDITEITGVYTHSSIQRYKAGAVRDPRYLTTLMVPPAYVENLDSLAPPDRTQILHIPYRSIVGASDHMTTMISSRGCPYSCSYCDVPYKRYRQRSLASVADEVGGCLDLGYNEIHFYDDLFNIAPERVIGFCSEVQKRGYRFTWDFRGRVNSVTFESLQRARLAGCRMISFGVETGSDEGLRLLGKNTSTEQVRQVFKWCRSLGILTIADFMIGLPFERSADEVRRNVDFLLGLDPDYAQFSILSLYPNTEIFADAARRGLIQSGRWKVFAREPEPVFFVDHWNEFLTTSELVSLQKEAYQRFYLRPRYIWRSLVNTCSWHEFTSKLQGAERLILH